ncbi:MAG: MFS transporter [Clostridia bacterium]
MSKKQKEAKKTTDKKFDVAGLVKKVKKMWKTPPEGRSLCIKEMGTFGLYALGNSFMSSGLGYVVSVAFLPYFYHIDTIHAYIILALGAVLNLILQPIIGNLMEKTHTKWGRYKPYILFSVPIFMMFIILSTWIPQFSVEKERIMYAYLTCVPVLILQNFASNMYNTMPTVITPVSQERADMMTPIGLIVGFAPSVMQVVLGLFRGYFQSKGKEYMALRITGIVSALLGMALVMFIIKVKERVYVVNDKKVAEEKVGFGKAAKMLFKNKPLMIAFLALSLGAFREFVRQFQYLVFQTRFSADINTALSMSGLVMTVIGFASTVAMFLLPFVTRKMDKHKACIMFTIGGATIYGLLGLIGYQNIPVGWVSSVVLIGSYFVASITPVYLLVPMMLGEIADYQQRTTGRRLEGHIQALLYAVPLVISQVGMILIWFLQKKIGFEPGNYNVEGLLQYTVEQQAIACNWFNAASIISSISGFLMVITMCFYPLSRKKYAQVMVELKEKATLNVQSEINLFGEAVVEEVVEKDENCENSNKVESGEKVASGEMTESGDNAVNSQVGGSANGFVGSADKQSQVESDENAQELGVTIANDESEKKADEK